MQTNTQNVCPHCGGPGYHVRDCKLYQALPVESVEKVLEQTQQELNTANKAANEAEAQFRKAKEWNALCELELNNLRSIAEDQDQELSALRIMLLELCEKMEAGISGPEETKRARVLLDAIKANQEKKS